MSRKQFRTNFASRLAAQRIARQLTQADLARLTGFPAAAISHWETARRTPTVESLHLLCAHLKADANYILGL